MLISDSFFELSNYVIKYIIFLGRINANYLYCDDVGMRKSALKGK